MESEPFYRRWGTLFQHVKKNQDREGLDFFFLSGTMDNGLRTF